MDEHAVALRSARGIALIALPVLLFATMLAAFSVSVAWLGRERGYLIGFAFYWLFWCLLVPRLFLGGRCFASILASRVPLFTWANAPAALLFAMVTVTAATLYASGFVHAPWLTIVVAAPFAVIDGICEEILWRGLYVRMFAGRPLLAIIYSALGYAVWHFVPQMDFPSSSGAVPFVASTFCLGLTYGFIAYRTGTARWTAVSHSFNGFLALGGHLGSALLTLL